jgi:hypothetical protein
VCWHVWLSGFSLSGRIWCSDATLSPAMAHHRWPCAVARVRASTCKQTRSTDTAIQPNTSDAGSGEASCLHNSIHAGSSATCGHFAPPYRYPRTPCLPPRGSLSGGIAAAVPWGPQTRETCRTLALLWL